jgi:hypothetical protein
MLFGRPPGADQLFDQCDLFLGAVDGLLTIAVTLCNKGILDRGRHAPVAYLARFFELAVVGDRRFTVIDGGRPGPDDR